MRVEVEPNRSSASRSLSQRPLLTCLLAALFLSGGAARGAEYGRVSGSVADPQGNPLIGATVFISGPTLPGVNSLAPQVERILTDASGKFAAGHLLPGWYSLRVTALTRVPVVRTGIHVLAGETVQERFVLSDIFASIRLQAPPSHLSNWGDDWKWVLRTSASTRPVLRFKDEKNASASAGKPPVPPGERLIGISPSTVGDAANGDQGEGGIAAYLLPLSAASDLLVAARMTTDGEETKSLAMSLRRNLTNGPDELTLSIHQMSLANGVVPQSVTGNAAAALNDARALSAGYESTRRLSNSVVITSGIEVDYLEAGASVRSARPHLTAEYRPDSSNIVSVRFGAFSPYRSGTLLERVGRLSAFPQVTLSRNRARLEAINHAEVSFDHKIGKSSRVEIAAFRDGFGNTAVLGFGRPQALAWLAGSMLPNPVQRGVILDAGNYGSAGARATFATDIGRHLEAAVVYNTGSALTAKSSPAVDRALPGNLREALSTERSQTATGKITALLPVSKTEITTSYQWMQAGRVTSLDPYGQASMELAPFLGVQIRQPLPTIAFLPAHIEALADCRNLLAQGYVPISRGGEQFTLAPVYRTFRGGFSVEF